MWQALSVKWHAFKLRNNKPFVRFDLLSYIN